MTWARETVALDTKAMVDDVMRRWPATVGVFLRFRMKCIGCPFGGFHSVEHAAWEHEQEIAPFVAALEKAIEGL